jgi:hypothetical protein
MQGGCRKRQLNQLMENQEKLLTGFGSDSGLYGSSGCPKLAPLYYSPCAELRFRLAKLRFNKLVKSVKTQLPFLYWVVGYIGISAFWRRQFSGPRGGSLLCRQNRAPSGTEGGGSSGRALTNRRILRQRVVEGGCRRAASNPQNCKLWCYIIFL